MVLVNRCEICSGKGIQMYGKPQVNVYGNYRKRVTNKRADKKGFTKSAGYTNAINLRREPMRGGFRL